MNVYDFDGTIYNGDSTADFYLYSLKNHLSIIKYFPKLTAAFTKYYILKKGTKTQFKETMYMFLNSCNAAVEVTDFWKAHAKKIKTWYLEQKKEDDVIISASPVFLLGPICKELNIKHLIASRVDSKTGKYNGENCHGEEKVKLFYLQFPNAAIENFYSDSYHDTPLAKIAQNSFLVKGDKISDWIFK